jgi:cold shock CspA family protein
MVMVDLKIQYLGFSESEAVSAAVWDYVEHLEKLYGPIISCTVVISNPHRKHQKGRIYHIKVRMHLSGADIIVDKGAEKNHAHEDIYVALRDAFDAAKRKLADFSRIQEGRIKEKNSPMHARILRLVDYDDCGFVVTEDNREIYFHRNALVNADYEKLQVGQEVRFAEAMGEHGPQITSLQVIGNSGRHVAR